MPKKTEPARLIAAIDRSRPWRRPRTAAQASQLAARKQIEPKRSGRQIRRSSWLLEIALPSARPVLRLKNSVPANWMIPAHQFSRSERGVAVAWRAAALVKNSEPTKNTAASATAPTRCTKPGNGPATKQAEPIANSRPIHLVLDTERLSHARRGGLSPRSDDDRGPAGAEHRRHELRCDTSPPRPLPGDRPRGHRRRPRRVRHHRRPREADDAALPVPAREARAAQVPDRRRRGPGLDGRRPARARPRGDRRRRRAARPGGLRPLRRPPVLPGRRLRGRGHLRAPRRGAGG